MKKMKTYILIGILGGILSACGILSPSQPTYPPELINTEVAQTIQAQLTQSAYQTLEAQLTSIATQLARTPTPGPTATTTLPIYPSPTYSFPTATSLPPTPRPPTATPIPIPCNRAKFIADVTVPDGSQFPPSAQILKTWRLENTGTCTWDGNYATVFVSGDKMGAPSAVSIPKVVRPGEQVDITVDFIAPSQPGRYRSNWMLRDNRGNIFGIGQNANSSFWVDIQVLPTNQRFDYDMAISLCSASWQSGSGILPCPGNPSSPNGSISLLRNPVLENGRHEDEGTLLTRPETVANGWILGIYPSYTVKAGDHFLADVGCLENSNRCQVIFTVAYRLPDGTVRKLGDWYDTYDGNVLRVDVDLSSLAGNKIQLILRVDNVGNPKDANAFWLAPSVRQSDQSAPIDRTPAALAARQRLAQDTGIAIDNINVTKLEPAEWSDSCLGVRIPDMVCSQVIVPGYRIIMTANGRQYEAHTNQDGSIVFWFQQ